MGILWVWYGYPMVMEAHWSNLGYTHIKNNEHEEGRELNREVEERWKRGGRGVEERRKRGGREVGKGYKKGDSSESPDWMEKRFTFLLGS